MRLGRIVAIAIGLFVSFFVVSLPAGMIIEETFTDYPDNALLSAHPAGDAVGLTGDWTLDADQDFYVNRTQADLNAGTGKAVYDMESDFNGARTATRVTSAKHVLFENDGDVFYASFLIDPGRADGTMTFELEIQRLDNGGVQDFLFGMIEGQYIVGNGGVGVRVGRGAATADEQLVVVRVAYGATESGPDKDEVVTLWANPIDESSPPVIDNVAAPVLNRGGGKITSVSLRGGQMDGSPAFFDNLRVGTSFAAVVPEPSALGLLAIGLFAMSTLIWRRR